MSDDDFDEILFFAAPLMVVLYPFFELMSDEYEERTTMFHVGLSFDIVVFTFYALVILFGTRNLIVLFYVTLFYVLLSALGIGVWLYQLKGDLS